VVRRQVLASLLFRQHLEIAPERHPLFIVVKKVPDARRRRPMGEKTLCFLGLIGNSQDKIQAHVPESPILSYTCYLATAFVVTVTVVA
jgi:hypothetical protein